MAKRNPALEGNYKSTAGPLGTHWLKITFADYDTGAIKGTFGNQDFISAGYSRDAPPSEGSDLNFNVGYDVSNTNATGLLKLRADDHSYSSLYGTWTPKGSTPPEPITLSKFPS